MPKNNDKLIKNRYLKKSFLSKLIFSIIFPLSTNKAIGKTVTKPTKNLAALKVNGPILSIPVSWAIKAVPHKKEQETAQVIEIKLLFIIFNIVI